MVGGGAAHLARTTERNFGRGDLRAGYHRQLRAK